MKSRTKRKLPNTPVKAKPECSSWVNRWVYIGLTILLSVIYLSTLLPGVSSGDAAQLQYSSTLVGTCHPPGYHIEVTFGKLFSILPIGPDIAWRINFMMTVFGVIGCLAFYGAIRRITGFIIPAVIAATTLAFSSVYWTHCLHPEAYVFYGTFLLLGIYTIVRFIESNKAVWLYLTALVLGICIADRSSELFVMPAFLVLWLFVRKKVKLSPVRILLGLFIFVLPFVYTVSFYLMRNDPAALSNRDGVLRQKITTGDFNPPEKTDYEKVQFAVRRSLGLNYTAEAKFKAAKIRFDIDKYAWLLSGVGAFGDRYAPTDHRSNSQGRGSSITIAGLLLGVLAIAFWRRQYGWVLFGLLMFLGNLVFILYHSRWDNLTFTIPGLIGLCILVGLGSVGPDGKDNHWKQIVFQAICLIVPLFLLITNYHLLDRSTPEEKRLLEYNHKLAIAPVPKNSVILDTFWPAMTYRYLFYIESKRTDINVMYISRDKWGKLIEYFNGVGRPIFINARHFNHQSRRALLKQTPPEIAKLEFVLLNPKVISK